MTMPSAVTIVEVGPRDGLQNEAAEIPIEVKLGFIDRLGAAGLCVIEATSFVHPRAVPQLADADALFPSIERRPASGTRSSSRRSRGLERALAAGADEVAVVIGATDSFNRANLSRTTEDALADAAPSSTARRTRSIRVRGYVSVAFGCPYEGAVAPSAGRRRRAPARRARLRRDRPRGHDRRRRRPPTSPRVLEAVVPSCRWTRRPPRPRHARAGARERARRARGGGSTIDSSAGGLGGCPFAGPGAVGNLATEDLVYLLDGLGIEHGVSLDGVIAASAFIESAVGHPLRARRGSRAAGPSCGPRREPTA